MGTIFSRKPTLEGTRVTLRPIRAADAPTMHRLLGDPDGLMLNGTVHSSSQVEEPWTVDDLIEVYERWSSADDRLVLAIIDSATENMIGELVLNDLDAENRSCGFRIYVGADGRGRGAGTEATELIVRYALHDLGLHRVMLEVYDFNPRARHVYEKVGFRHEGTGRDALRFDDDWIDVHYMSILETDIG